MHIVSHIDSKSRGIIHRFPIAYNASDSSCHTLLISFPKDIKIGTIIKPCTTQHNQWKSDNAVFIICALSSFHFLFCGNDNHKLSLQIVH